MAEELDEILDVEVQGDPVDWLMRRWDDVLNAVESRLKYGPMAEELDEVLEFYRKYKPIVGTIDERYFGK